MISIVNPRQGRARRLRATVRTLWHTAVASSRLTLPQAIECSIECSVEYSTEWSIECSIEWRGREAITAAALAALRDKMTADIERRAAIPGSISALHRQFACSASALHRLHTGATSALHRLCIGSASAPYRLYIGSAPAPYLLCIGSTSGLQW